MAFLTLSTYGDVPVDLDAGSCQLEPVLVGGLRRAYGGVMHSSIRKRLRRWRVRLVRVPRTTGDVIVAGLQSTPAIAASGDLIDPHAGDSVDCFAELVRIEHPKHATGEYQVIEFILHEVDESSGFLLFSFDGDSPGAYTYTRPSVANDIDQNGLYVSRAIDVPRFAYLYRFGQRTRRALLLEAATTNEITAFSYGAGGTHTPNVETSPFGDVTLGTWIENSSSGLHRFNSSSSMTVAAGARMAISTFVRDLGRPDVELMMFIPATTNSVRVKYNLDNETAAVQATSCAECVCERAYVVDWSHVSLGLKELVLVARFDTAHTVRSMVLALLDPTTKLDNYAGDGVSGVATGWWQAEEGASFASSLTSGTRAASIFSRDYTPVPQQSTLYGRIYAPEEWFVHIGNAAGTGARLSVFMFDDEVTLVHNNGVGEVESTVAMPALDWDALVEFRAQVFDDGSVQLHVSVDEGAELSGSVSSPLQLALAWADEKLWLNHTGVGAPFRGGFYESVKHVRGTAFTMADMRGLSRVRPFALLPA